MLTFEQIEQAYRVFESEISEYSDRGLPLPDRGTTRAGLHELGRRLRGVNRAGDLAGKTVRETLSNNKRQIANTVFSAGTGVAISTGLGALGVASVAGPQAVLTVPITVTVGLAFFAGTQLYGRHQLKEARKAILTQYLNNPEGVDHGKLAELVKGSELTTLAKHFEDAFCRAEEVGHYRFSNLDNIVGYGGTCFRAVERLHKLLMWKRAIERLLVGGEIAPGTGLMNVLVFVDLVPRKLYEKAEATLAECGKAAVEAMERVDFEHPSLPHFQRELRVLPADEGLLKWATWAQDAPWSRTTIDDSATALLRAWVQPHSDSKKYPTLKKWRAAFEEADARVNTKDARVNTKKGTTSFLKNQNTKVKVFNTVGKPLTKLIIKELATNSFQNPASWAHGGAGAGLGLVMNAPVSLAFGAIAEAINAKIDAKKIFSNTTSLQEKVRAIATVLQHSGISEMETLDKEMTALCNSIPELAADVGPSAPIVMRKAGEEPYHHKKLKMLLEQLYSLHEKLAQLATLHTLCEFLLDYINEGVVSMPELWNQRYHEFKEAMKHRLADEGGDIYHTQCKTACYRIILVEGEHELQGEFVNPLPSVRG
jgi:hypothetical protein